MAAAVEGAGLIYLSGGDPAYLFGCLPVGEVDLKGNWHVLGRAA